jgi:acyl carrier protein
VHSKQEIQERVKKYVLEEFLPGEDPAALTIETVMVSSGVLDSIATLKLVTFLEDEFKIQVHAHEADADHLDTLALISEFVAAKL